MKLVKSLLLGSAAGLLAVASSQAADLPYKKAAPVEYVKICDAHGAGFFYIPGTDTCLKVGGDVEFYYSSASVRGTFTGYHADGTLVGGSSARFNNYAGAKARGRVQLDARNTTAWGTLRAFVSVQTDHQSGLEEGGPNSHTQNDHGSLDKAYIQFAGFTAGFYQSVFDFYADNWNHWDLDDSDTSTVGLAYTATFGGGFSATISAEDRAERLGNYSAGTAAFLSTAPAGTVPGVLVNTTGDQWPDIVGQINLSQAWGQVQATGAIHQVSTFLTPGADPAGTGPDVDSKDTIGYAGQLGIEINLPSLAAGDQLWLEGAYTNGAGAYNQVGTCRGSGGYTCQQFIAGGVDQNDYDAIWTSPTHLSLQTSWSVMGAFQHYFTPTIVGRLSGSYLDVHYNNVAAFDALTSSYTRIKVGPQLYWLPVAGFQIGVEALYVRQDDKFPIAVPGAPKDVDGYVATLHVERDF